MLFHKPVTDIIQQRKSIRSYSGTPIEEDKKEALRKFLSANTIGPLGTEARVDPSLADAAIAGMTTRTWNKRMGQISSLW